MKVRTFTSLEDLNKFLEEELGVAPLPLTPEQAEGATFNVRMEGEETDQAPDDHRLEELQAKLESYIEMSTDQLALVIRQRDEAIELAGRWEERARDEHQSHHECHESFEEALHKVRVQGYAEGVANGLYPGKPFETLEQSVQDAIMRQAQASIAHLDDIRSSMYAPSVH